MLLVDDYVRLTKELLWRQRNDGTWENINTGTVIKTEKELNTYLRLCYADWLNNLQEEHLKDYR